MAEEGILERLGQELRLKESDVQFSDKESVNVVDRAKSRPHVTAAALHLGQQSVQEQPNIQDILKQQTELMGNLMKEFSDMKKDVAKLNALATDSVYEDVSDDESVVQTPESECKKDAHDDGQVKAPASILGQCAESLALTERKGDPSSAEMAQLVQKLVALNIDDKKRSELTEKHMVPENVSVLAAPKVNQEIWRVISTECRSRDIKSQKIQNGFLGAGVPVVRAVDKLLADKDKLDGALVQEVVTLLVDSLALIANSSADMNMRRRDMIKMELNEEYQALCSQQNPVTQYLFGDNISEQLKVIAETNKVGLKVKHQRRGQEHRFHPQGKHQKRNPFLGGRNPSHNNAFRGRGRGRRTENSSGHSSAHKPQNYQKKQ